jgi:hypothetical protein
LFGSFAKRSTTADLFFSFALVMDLALDFERLILKVKHPYIHGTNPARSCPRTKSAKKSRVMCAGLNQPKRRKRKRKGHPKPSWESIVRAAVVAVAVESFREMW